MGETHSGQKAGSELLNRRRPRTPRLTERSVRRECRPISSAVA